MLTRPVSLFATCVTSTCIFNLNKNVRFVSYYVLKGFLPPKVVICIFFAKNPVVVAIVIIRSEAVRISYEKTNRFFGINSLDSK